jgi:hypothetical protein
LRSFGGDWGNWKNKLQQTIKNKEIESSTVLRNSISCIVI